MVKKRDRGIRYFILSTSVILLVLLIIGVFSGALFSDQIKLSGGGSVNNVNLVLSKDKFGSNENLKGSLTIDHTGELDLDEEVTFEVLECSSYAKRKFSLFQVLNGTGLTSEEVSSFARGNSSSSYTAINNNLVGFYYEGVPNNVEFNINGNANFLKLDFGNDGSEDWGFSGERTGWDTEIKPNTICSDYSGTSEFNPHTTINQNLVFNYSGTANEIDLKLNVVAKSVGTNANNLTVRVNNQVCSLSGITSSYNVLSNCQFKIPVVEGENVVPVRLITIDNNYAVPKCVGENYYFITGNLGLYNNQIIPGTTYKINSTHLANLMYSNKICENNACFSVARIVMNSGDSLNFNNLILKTSTGNVNGFWSVQQEVNSVNVNGKNFSIDNLKLPTPQIDTACELNVEVMGEEASDTFDVLASPTAIISLDSEFATTSQAISMFASSSSAPSGRTITGYKWYFGDNLTGTGQNVTHAYTREGTYKLTLEVTDNLGIKDTAEKEIIVGNLENYLDNVLDETLDEISNSDLNGLSLEAENVLDALHLRDNLTGYEDRVSSIKTDFVELKNSNSSLKQTRYAQMASELKEIRNKYPVFAETASKSGSVGFFMDSYEKIYDYKTSGISNVKEYKAKIYDYNLNQVNFDNKYALVKINFLGGEKSYLLVDKTISAPSGNNEYVEGISQFYGKNLTKISEFNVEGDFLTKEFSSSLNVKYVVESSSLIEIEGVVYTDVELSEPIWQENCPSGNCDYAYCGDNICNSGYETENSCEQDCKPQRPNWLFYVLGGVFIIGIVYIWLYKGPGNFKDFSNSVSIKLIGKRVFTNKEDLNKLESYVNEMMKKGFTERQLTLALSRKGWTEEQVNYVFKNIKR